jgi:FMNH2-dependent dimethyl sulfone monooxygenase
MPTYGGWLNKPELEEIEITYENVKSAALVAEKIGLDSIWVADHLLNPLKGEQENCLEAWTTLTAVGAVTSKVKVAHTTLCQGFRYPTVLAKMASTLMEITKDRFILSIGAGWYKREFESYGIPWEEHDTRVARTEEQIQIIKSLWTQELTNFEGNFYNIIDGRLKPKPNNIPEIWYGGESDASKQLIIRNCDVWLMYDSSPEEVSGKIKDFQTLLGNRKMQYAVSTHVIPGVTDEEAQKRLESLTQGNSRIKDRIKKIGIVGSPNTVKEKLTEYSNSGIDHLLLKFSQTTKDLLFLKEILREWMSE